MLDGYANLIDLIGQLPSDFKRVEESVLDMHRQILRDFRDEDRPVVDVLASTWPSRTNWSGQPRKGRAFDGAFVLLRDDALLQRLRENMPSRAQGTLLGVYDNVTLTDAHFRLAPGDQIGPRTSSGIAPWPPRDQLQGGAV